MAEGPGCQVDAGIILANCKLTPKAKTKFIQAIKDELMFGTDNLPIPPLFPCGVPVPPNPFASLLDLENEEKFPDFHKNILGSYEKIACALNMKSDMKLLPICCPISLAFKLGANIKLKFPGGFIPFMIPNPPLLALKMSLMPPPKLIAKFPGIPSVPPPIPSFDIPPDIKQPDFSTLFDYSLAFAIGIPKFLLKIAGDMPKLALKLGNLPDLFSAICDIAFESNLFGDMSPDSIVQIVATKVLTTKVVEMVFIAAVGTTLGSSPGGITGGIGRFLGYEPPGDESEEEQQSIRDKIVSYALDLDGAGYGQGDFLKEKYTSHLFLVEFPEPQLPSPPGDPRALGEDITYGYASTASSCGLLARACLANAGASYIYDQRVDTSKQDPNAKLYYDFFLDRYKTGTAIAGIYGAAKAKNALIPYTGGDLPALKKGDVIITEVRGTPGREHAIVLVEDYSPGSMTMTTVEGGQTDEGNNNKPTMIRKKEYVGNRTVPEGSQKFSMFLNAQGDIVLAGRTVRAIVDSEKLCTDLTGSDMSRSNGALPASYANDGPGDGFQEYESGDS